METRYDCDSLIAFAQKLFVKAGVPAADAAALAEALVLTDMRGIWSHGVIRSAHYLQCLQAGGIKPAAELAVIAEGPCYLRLSAQGGLGIPSSMRAIDMMLERASKQAVFITTLNHSDHFGAAGLYAQRLAEHGLLGYAMSNTPPMMAITGASARAIGNNPWAYAAPGSKYRGMLFDICMAVVASGKVQIAMAENKKIPYGWIADKDGNPSNDPADVLKKGGFFLPVGDHKGYGFALMVEIMTGVLGGAGVLGGVHAWNKQPGRDANTGQCFVAINPEFFGGLAPFRAQIDHIIDTLLQSPKAPGVERILYPGQLEFEKEAAARQHGVLLTEASLQELRAAADLVQEPFSITPSAE